MLTQAPPRVMALFILSLLVAGNGFRSAGSSHHYPASSRVSHKEGGSVGHYQRHLGGVRRANQVRSFKHFSYLITCLILFRKKVQLCYVNISFQRLNCW